MAFHEPGQSTWQSGSPFLRMFGQALGHQEQGHRTQARQDRQDQHRQDHMVHNHWRMQGQVHTAAATLLYIECEAPDPL